LLSKQKNCVGPHTTSGRGQTNEGDHSLADNPQGKEGASSKGDRLDMKL